MLKQLKQRIEARIGKPIDNGDLLRALEMAKSDVVSNKLIWVRCYSSGVRRCCG